MPKRHPRSVQERPRGAPELPKAGAAAHKSDPRGARTRPKPSPKSPETSFEQEFCGKLHSAGSGNDFMTFFSSCEKLAICENLRKTWEKLLFLHIRSCVALKARCHEKPTENRRRGAPKPVPECPGTLQNRVRGAPGAVQGHQNQPRATTNAARSAKKRPRAQTSVNIGPTWLQQGQQHLRSG